MPTIEGGVAGLFESLRQSPFVGRQAVGVVREDHQRLQAKRIGNVRSSTPRATACRRAAVEGLEGESLRRKLVDVRGLDLAAAIA